MVGSAHPTRMSLTQTTTKPEVPPAVQSVLDALRRRIRRYVWLEGFWAAAVWLGFAFWTSMAIDWIFEPPLGVRMLLLIVAGAGLLGVLIYYIGRRALVPLSDGNMATVLERRFPALGDTLLTSVLLVPQPPDETGYHPDMLGRTCREAERRIAGVRLREVFDPMPLWRKGVIAMGLASIVGLLAVAAPEALAIWTQRNLLLSERSWPRKVVFEAVGFTDGVVKVASGADFDLRVRAYRGDADLVVIPKAVEVRYRIVGGSRDRRMMNLLGVGSASPAAGSDGRDLLQEYGFTFRGVLSAIRFDVVGGDARLHDLRIQVVPNPTLSRIELEYNYPAYMDRPRQTVPVAGAMPVPLGTRLVVRGRANKELESVRIELPGTEKRLDRTRWLKGADLADDREGFADALAPIDRDTTLLFTLFDVDGIKSREPIPLSLVAVPDDPPQMAVRLAGIGTAITPQARLPVVGRITDDYGIAKTWFEYAVEKQKPGEVPVATLVKHPTDLPLAGVALEAASLKVVRGQKLSIVLKAADLCDLGHGPNVGGSETWLLDVVSPDELRAMLEARELVLRQRFEAIIEEMTETRNLLLRMDFTEPAAKKDDKKAAEKKAAGAEPGDAPAAVEPLSPEERLVRQTERVLQALQNCRKNAQETAGVTESIEDIRQQLTNNRIDTEELRSRLGAGIAEPLHHIDDDMFPELERRLERLQAAAGDLKLGPDRRDAARRQADDVLLAMRSVLSRMVELEDFNELVERLRTIVQLQEQIEKQTKERQKQQRRDLLEEK